MLYHFPLKDLFLAMIPLGNFQGNFKIFVIVTVFENQMQESRMGKRDSEFLGQDAAATVLPIVCLELAPGPVFLPEGTWHSFPLKTADKKVEGLSELVFFLSFFLKLDNEEHRHKFSFSLYGNKQKGSNSKLCESSRQRWCLFTWLL